ncbi:MCE family protein [Solicola sp. PLA-1-18]|uniref:MCE family protein n=1 Tax=Solicola sp. PLA-1-18 TaxID=3380532 RepID=UPI003B7A536C
MTDRPSIRRTLGVGFLALLLVLLYLTYAVYNKKFVAADRVTITTTSTGLQLPKNADVKIRGMIVGQVRDVQPKGDEVQISVAMEPDKIGRVPSNVSALLVPKTLFGEKYVALQVPQKPARALRAGDDITQASVPIEVETVLNDVYPLLQTVQPEELSYTLNAVATALDGRGEAIGDNLVRFGGYLNKVEPLTPTLVDDIDKLGQVSDQYADVMPELGDTLRNTVVTGNTVVAKRAQLQAFFAEGTRLSDTTTTFLDDNGDNLIGLANESLPSLGMLREYSPVLPCLLEGIDKLTPRIDSVFRDNRVNINLELIPLQEQATGYAADETPRVPSDAQVRDDQKFLGPNCQTLPNIPYSQADPAPIPPLPTLKTLGLKDSHNGKFGRVDPSSQDPLVDMVQPSTGTTPSETKMMKSLLAPAMGTDAADVSDAATLFAAPFLRGAGVTYDAAP